MFFFFSNRRRHTRCGLGTGVQTCALPILVKPRTSADSDIYLLDTAAADAKPKLITPHDGNISHGVHEFTPDSGKLVYSTDEHGEFQQAWTYDLGTGETEPLVSADWNVDRKSTRLNSSH